MAIGKVKWFNNAKGYGFVLPEEGGEDLFVHYSAIQMDGYKTLKAGQDVQFDIVEGPKGLHAVNIQNVAGEAEDGLGVSVEFELQHDGHEQDADGAHAVHNAPPDASSA